MRHPTGASWPRQPRTDIGADFRRIPLFPEKVLEKRHGHLIVQDWKGNVCEISDQFDFLDYCRLLAEMTGWL